MSTPLHAVSHALHTALEASGARAGLGPLPGADLLDDLEGGVREAETELATLRAALLADDMTAAHDSALLVAMFAIVLCRLTKLRAALRPNGQVTQ